MHRSARRLFGRRRVDVPIIRSEAEFLCTTDDRIEAVGLCGKPSGMTYDYYS